MAVGTSCFYPPRARWYSPCLYLARRVCRRLRLDRFHLPGGLSIPGALACIFVPGAAFYVQGPRLRGQIALVLCAVLVILMIGWFGFPSAAVAFGLVLAIHAAGLAMLLEPALGNPTLRVRLLLTVSLLFVLAGTLYLPGRRLILDRLFFPLRLNGQVIVVHRASAPVRLHRGDIIAYSFEGFARGELFVRGGYGLGPILAGPGDELQFDASSFVLNGVPQPRLSLMPQAGVWQVPEKHWFVWPQFATGGHGAALQSGVAERLMSLAIISDNQIIGKPCRWWLWRRQRAL